MMTSLMVAGLVGCEIFEGEAVDTGAPAPRAEDARRIAADFVGDWELDELSFDVFFDDGLERSIEDADAAGLLEIATDGALAARFTFDDTGSTMWDPDTVDVAHVLTLDGSVTAGNREFSTFEIGGLLQSRDDEGATFTEVVGLTQCAFEDAAGDVLVCLGELFGADDSGRADPEVLDVSFGVRLVRW